MKEPFLIFSWYRAFLPDLKARILVDTDGHPGNAIIIVPNKRPWRYLADLFAQDRRSTLLPQMIAFADMAAIWRRYAAPDYSKMASPLDQVALLKDCVAELAKEDEKLAGKFAAMDLAHFFPWGMKLSALLEEIYTQGFPPKDLHLAEEEVGEYGAALISSLGQIGAKWEERAVKAGYTTSAYDVYLAAKKVALIPPRLCPSARRKVYIAGFSALTGSQKAIFYSLWAAGAHICLHGDPALATGGEIDPACQDQLMWIEKWKADAILASPPGQKPTRYAFFAGYDGHSQLEQLIRDAEEENGKSSAIVVPDPGLLMPILHHLPDKSVNISMGYPLSRTRLYGLLKEVFMLHTRKRPAGQYYWRDLRRIFYHPLLTMLETATGSPLREALQKVQERLAEGSRFIDVEKLLEEAATDMLPEDSDLLLAIGGFLFTGFQGISTPAMLAQHLTSFCDFLLNNSAIPRDRFPIDEEALARLRDDVLPVLAESLLADEKFSLAALQTLLFMLLDAERIPFEADPLVGMQIIGMLETRLLHFDRLFIVDASDDLLPGRKAQDPLLPDNMRGLAGLPDNRSRQAVVANNLFRLCNNADKVNFYWAEGTVPSGMDTGKRFRSRFLEKLIWEIEQREKRVLITGEGELRAAVSEARVNLGLPWELPRPESLNARVKELLARPLSATLCAEYIKCPVKFAYGHVLRLTAPAEVNEEEDPRVAGAGVHTILANLFRPWVNQDVPDRSVLKANLNKCFDDVVQAQEFIAQFPVDSWLFFNIAAKKRLACYLEKGPLRPVKGVEKEMLISVPLLHGMCQFKGKIDRLDEEGGRIFVMDYKTGTPHTLNQAFWRDQEFFANLTSWINALHPDMAAAAGYMEIIRTSMPDIQLPVYVLMLEKQYEIMNAGYIYLQQAEQSEKAEVWLWDKDIDRPTAIENCRILVSFILKHLETAASFAPHTAICEKCEYNMICYSK